MRSETTLFERGEDYVCAWDDNRGLINIKAESKDGDFAELTKQQAREFARQLLEMCGEE